MMNMNVAPPQEKKEVLKVPPELEVAEGMNEEDLKKYMFPNIPVEPWYNEQILCKQLDTPCELGNPPPYVSAPYDPKHDHKFEVSSKLAEWLMKEFRRPKYARMKANNEIKPGEAVDLEHLLFPCQGDYLIRRKGRGKIKAKSLKGKYILVCCCYAPMVWLSTVWQAVYACSEMYSKLKGNFEMVIVTKMRCGWTQPRGKEKDAFRQFFSAFPPPCLAVPLHARSRRRRIFNSLRVGVTPKFLLLGPDGHALLHRELNMFFMIDLVPINVIGSDPTQPFPFISRNYSSLWTPLPSPIPDCSCIVNSPSSLKRILSPSSDFLFRKEGEREPYVKKEVSLSDLNSKPVALYLYSNGEKLPLLRHIVQGCRQTNKDLEVVVVYLQITDDSSSFPEMLSGVLAPRRLSWWVAPHNFSSSIVLRTMFEFQGDRVIIIGPNEQYVDVRGLQLMEIYGVYAYPFCFGSVVRKTVEELSQVTLDSFKKLLQIPECQEYPSTAKKVLFYFDYPYNISPTVHEQLIRFGGYQGVRICPISFVDGERFGNHARSLCQTESRKPTDLTLAYLWQTKGADKASDFFLRFFNHEFPTIIAFGENGRICSLLAHNLPPSDRPEFKGNLCEEVSSILDKYIRDYDDQEYNYDGGIDHGLAYVQELRQSKFW